MFVSNMVEIGRSVIEGLSLPSQKYVLGGYLEYYQWNCAVCCGHLKGGSCPHDDCAGPASMEEKDFVTLALDSWADNALDAGFDVETTDVLIDALQARDHEAGSLEVSFADAEHNKPMQALLRRYWILLPAELRQMVMRKVLGDTPLPSGGLYCEDAFYKEVHQNLYLCTRAVEALIPLVGYSREALGSDLER